MTDYSPIVEPIGWNNAYSVSFCTLLGISSAAQIVQVMHPIGLPSFTQVSADGNLQTRAATLMRRELVARLACGSKDFSVDAYDRLAGKFEGVLGGKADADEFAFRGPLVHYQQVGGLVNRFSVPVPRKSGLDVTDLFVQSDAIAFYATELAAVIAAVPQLVADVATQAAKNVAQDSVVAATVAAALVASRAAYVSQLAASYPTRGYA